MKRRCCGCGKVKNLNEFSIDKWHALGRNYECIDCKKIYHIKWFSKNKDYYKKQHQLRKLKDPHYFQKWPSYIKHLKKSI